MKRQIVIDYLLLGRAYIFKEQYLNDIISLRYVRPINVQPLKDVNPVFKNTLLNVNGKIYENCVFISLLRNTDDGATGEGVLQEISKALETAYQTILLELGLAKKVEIKRFLTSQHKIDPDTMTRLKMLGLNYLKTIMTNKTISSY